MQKIVEIDNKTEDLFNEYSIGARPFIKWVGGKTQLLNQFKKLYPKEFGKGEIIEYFEPFLGGGAVFFDIAQNYKIKSAKLFDVNEELILVYKVVQKNVYKLIDFLEKYKNTYKNLKESERKEYFYTIRDDYNSQRFQIDFKKFSDNWIPRAAQMIFLNKTCFNGLYRVNLKGEFNVPFGNYINPSILDINNLINVSNVLSLAEIEVDSFKNIVQKISNSSFVYFDPPYRPINKTSSFTSYSTFEFNDKQQIQLALAFKKSDKKGAKLMLSNSDPKNCNSNDNFFDKLYANYNITRVSASRMVNSNGQKRGPITELVIRNYN